MESQPAGHAEEEESKRTERRRPALLHGLRNERENSEGRDAHDAVRDGQHDVVRALPEFLESLTLSVGEPSAEKPEEEREENHGEHFTVVRGCGKNVDRHGAADDVGQIAG